MEEAGPRGELAQPHASDYARAVAKPVYIHGLPGSPRELDLAGARDRFRAVSPFADSMAELAETPHPLDIHAFSLGAYAALRFAAEYPDKVASLTLISPAAPLELGDFLPDMAGGVVFRSAKLSPALFRALSAVQALAVRADPARALDPMFGSSTPTERALAHAPDTRTVFEDGLRYTFLHHRCAYIDTVLQYVRPWADTLRHVRAPVRIVAGMDDIWTPPAMVEALAKALPSHPTMEWVKGAGHYGALVAHLRGQ